MVDACRRCGLAKPVALCPLEQAAWQVDAVLAPFTYGAPLDHYLHALKYRGARLLGRAFALLLAPTLDALRHDVDALVAVPLHRTRLRERGYNQAQEIARTLGSVAALAGARARHRAPCADADADRHRARAAAGQRRAGF